MTYLATEMLLYLACASLIGLVLGWLFWGMGRQGAIARQHADLTAMIDAEQAANKQAQINLERAEARLQRAVQAEKDASAEQLAKAQESLEAERSTAQEARAHLEKVRLEMEQAVGAERVSATEAIDQAMRLADNHKTAASDAKTKETQFLAEVEELRLLVGAEKLAAQSARAELARVRADMETTLENERRANEQSRSALDDIRTTLARTFGADAAASALSSTGPGSHETSTMSLQVADGKTDEIVDRQADAVSGIGNGDGMPPSTNGTLANDDEASDDNMTASDHDDADIEDLEETEAVLSSSGDPDSKIELNTQTHSDRQPVTTNGSTDRQPDDAIDENASRPALLYDVRPDEVDDLKEIDGIEPPIELLLNDNGCYQFRQLAKLTTSDIAWLCDAINVSAGKIENDRWVEQAETLHFQKYGRRHDELPWYLATANQEAGS